MRRFKDESIIDYLEAQRRDMDSTYAPFESIYYDIADYCCPTLPQFSSTDINLGDRRSEKIVDNTATLYAQEEQAGMMSSITSPSRPWVKMAMLDERKGSSSATKKYLADVDHLIHTALIMSNFYPEIMKFYENAIHFGTAVINIQEDLGGKVAHFTCLPTGSYRLMDDVRNRANGISFKWRYSTRQLLEEFATVDKNGDIDWSNFSDSVKTAWEGKNDQATFEVVHMVVPNPDYVPGSKISSDKKWWSYYYELEGHKDTDAKDRFLRKSGFDDFDFYAFRWGRNSGDTYATKCPSINALSDIKQLQAMEEKKLLAIEKQVDPPVVAPNSLEGGGVNLLPGGVTYADTDNTASVRPLFEVGLRLNDLDLTMTRVRDRIARAYSAHLFRSISQFDEIQSGKMTATEVRIRQQEGMRQLGPVLEQLNNDVLGPLINRLFEFLAKQGLLPEPPAEIQGAELKIEYISIMAQAQSMESLAGIERLSAFVQSIAPTDQQVLDTIDNDFLVREYAKVLSLPHAARAEQEVDQLRLKRAQMVEAQQKAATLQQASQGLASLAQTPASEEQSLLDQQMGQLQEAGA